jgi:hypothetical protein
MIIEQGQIWQGFITFDELSIVTVLEVKVEPDLVFPQVINRVIGFTDDRDIYFWNESRFLRRFEYKG